LRRGRSSGVEHNLAKVGVEGSNPFARSNFRQWLKDDAQPRRLLSIVVYGRNGNHGYNLHKRAAASINCLAEMSRDPTDELIFVDYNSPDGLSTFAEAIRDILTSRAKAVLRFAGRIRVSPPVSATHEPLGAAAGGRERRSTRLQPSKSLDTFDQHRHHSGNPQGARLSKLVGDARESGHPGRPPLGRRERKDGNRLFGSHH
jgi:hypothetical protein